MLKACGHLFREGVRGREMTETLHNSPNIKEAELQASSAGAEPKKKNTRIGVDYAVLSEVGPVDVHSNSEKPHRPHGLQKAESGLCHLSACESLGELREGIRQIE
jgi:hypothetical protein